MQIFDFQNRWYSQDQSIQMTKTGNCANWSKFTAIATLKWILLASMLLLAEGQLGNCGKEVRIDQLIRVDPWRYTEIIGKNGTTQFPSTHF